MAGRKNRLGTSGRSWFGHVAAELLGAHTDRSQSRHQSIAASSVTTSFFSFARNGDVETWGNTPNHCDYVPERGAESLRGATAGSVKLAVIFRFARQRRRAVTAQ